jgi:hypothetical protein
MRLAIYGALFAVMNLLAQDTPLLSTYVGQLSDGRATVTIQNNSEAALSGLAITLTCNILPRSGSSRRALLAATREYRDSVIDPTWNSVPPNGRVTIITGAQGALNTIVQFRAGVFSDGSSFGDPDWVRMIVNRRSYTLRAIESALSALQGPIEGRSIEGRVRAAQSALGQPVTTGSHGAQLFRERDLVTKRANLALVARYDRIDCMDQIFRPILRNSSSSSATAASPMKQAKMLSSTTASLVHEKDKILAASPELKALHEQ